MGFITFSLDYYAKELKKLESAVANEETTYHAKQLLKMLDDLVDEGYTELNEKLEEKLQGVSRLQNYLKENGAEPFLNSKKNVAEKELKYSRDSIELVQALETAMGKAKEVSTGSKDPFLQELQRFCHWIGYEENTAYIFLLRDTLLPYVYYKANGRQAIYPWLLGRKTLECLTGKRNVDDEIRAAIIRALEERKCADFEQFCDSVLPDIRSVLKQYPMLENCLKEMLAGIKVQRIIVVESGCSGTFPMLLMSLDERVDVRMYTTYPYLTKAYGDKRIFTMKYEENRLFETFASQDLYFQFSDLRNGQFFVKNCEVAEVEEKALTELKAMME